MPAIPRGTTQQHPMYQALEKPKQFRILVLEPGKDDDKVSCHLVNVVLSWRTRYEALSYTWGDPTITEEITFNGHRKHVTANLQVALRYLRYEDRQRILWVDALCINQDDIDERESQVQMMGSIYSSARQVLIWLGEETGEVKGAFQVMKRLEASFAALHSKRYVSNRVPLLDSTLEALFPTSMLGPNFEWKPVIGLLQRPWFQRTWIIQEAILPSRATVICGHTVMPWHKFEKVMQGIQIYIGRIASVGVSEDVIHAVAAVNMIMEARAEHHGRGLRKIMSRNEVTKMLDLLLEFKSFQCSNKRDRIFGFLGVAKDKDDELVPDYRISVEEAFRRFVWWDIIKNGNLRVLSCSSYRSKSPYKLPSWVPDFTNVDDVHSLMRYEKRVNFNASKGTKPQGGISKDGQVLVMKGGEVDLVCLVGRVYNGKALFPSVASKRLSNGRLFMQSKIFQEQKKESQVWMLECMEIIMKIDCALGKVPKEKYGMLFSVSPERYEEFWRTMTCNHDGRALPARTIHGRWMPQFLDLLFADHKDHQWLLERFPAAQALERSIVVWGNNRRFCATRDGRIGWVPRDTREDDVVCVLFGGRVPYVLRPCERGYTLVGECYIHGLMEGEAMEMKGIVCKDFAIF